MSERNPDLKRDAEEIEASSTSVSPPKKKKLDDSSAESHVVVVVVPAVPSSSVASSAESAQGGCSVTSAGEDDGSSSSICSDSVSSESNEIARNSPTSVVDLEAQQISETETSTATARNFSKEGNPGSEALGEITEMESSSVTEKDDRREVSKKPTPEEIDDFFSELGDDDKQKRFIEKYNFDIVNDKPLEGRYKWDRVEPEKEIK
uniref:Cyclin-dependent kinase inhibitor n=1 Tax=Noccaea caerulescens TaxID=107243 RepID=A0A1J3ITX1_NOCCA